MASEGNPEVAKAFVTIVPTLQGSQATISKELGAEAEPAAKEVGEKSGKSFGESLAKGIKTAGAVIAGAMTAVTGAAVATGKAFIDTANDISAMGDSIGDNAAKMGISTRSYQEWDFVLQRAGSSIESMKSSMKTLANAAVSGNDAFQALGITQEQIASMSQEELFGATITALQGIEDSTTRTALASQLLGRGAIELGGIFDMTAEETEAAKQKMYELGAYMDEDAIAASDNYQDTMVDLQDSIKGLKMRVIGDFLPGITSVMDGLSKVFSGNGGVTEIQSGLQSIIDNLVSLAPQFLPIAETLILSLIQGFGPMLPSLVSSLFSIVVSAITTLTTMIPQMMPAIILGIQGIIQATFQALPIIIDGLFTLIMSLLDWLTSGDNIQNFVNSIVQLAVDIVSRFSEILPVLLPAIVMIITEICLALTSPENIKALIGAVIQVAVAIFEALVNCVPVLIDFIIGLFDNLGSLFAEFLLGWIIPKFTEWAVNAYNKIQEFKTKVQDFFSGMWTNIKNGVSSFFTAVGNFFSNGFTNIKTKVTAGLDAIKNKFTSIFDKVKENIKNALETIKGFFHFEWSLPKLKMPHFSISGSFSLDPPSIPRVSVDWYAKAMNEPYILDDATIFGASNGKLLGGGEAGSEIIVGTDKLMSMMKQAVGTGNGSPIVINVYGAEGQNVNDLAEAVAYKLEDLTKRKGMVYA